MQGERPPKSGRTEGTSIAKSLFHAVKSGVSPAHQRFHTTFQQPAKKLFTLFIAGTIAIHGFFLWGIRDRIVRADPDFTAYYTAAKIVRAGDGKQLYDPHHLQAVQRQFANDSDIRKGPLLYIHPPFEALLFVPLSFVPYGTAFIFWEVLNFGMLWLIAHLLRRRIELLGRLKVWQLLALSLAFFPVLANFHQGQDAILLLLVVTMFFCSLEDESVFWAGAWLALGLFRFQLVIPVFLVFSLWRGIKFVGGFATVALAEILVSLSVVGWRALGQYPNYVSHIVFQPALGGLPFRRVPNLLGLLAGTFPSLQEWPYQGIVLCVSLLILIWLIPLKTKSQSRKSRHLSLGCVLLAALLSGYSTNTYDLCLLIIPLVLTVDHVGKQLSSSKAILLAPIILLAISPLWFLLWMQFERLNLIAILILWWLMALRTEVVHLGQLNRSSIEV